MVKIDGSKVRSLREAKGLTQLYIATVVEVTTDNYGRMVGRVSVGETDVSLDLVRAGLAWHYKKYSKETLLSDAEVQARRNRTGLWVDNNPVPPWEFRHRGKQEKPEEKADGPFHGNIKSKVFHCPQCQHYNSKNCIVIFKAREEAKKAGYRPCGNCKP
jgi:micrococcal nuclease